MLTLDDVTWRSVNDPNVLARFWMDMSTPKDISTSEDKHFSPEKRISDSEEVILCHLHVLYLSSSWRCGRHRDNWAGGGARGNLIWKSFSELRILGVILKLWEEYLNLGCMSNIRGILYGISIPAKRPFRLRRNGRFAGETRIFWKRNSKYVILKIRFLRFRFFRIPRLLVRLKRIVHYLVHYSFQTTKDCCSETNNAPGSVLFVWNE